MELAQEKCTTYRSGSPPLTRKDILELLRDVPGWALRDGHLARTFELPDAAACIVFFSQITALATEEGHFPDICMRESRFVDISLYTYPAGGLTRNDFILAAKLNITGTTE